MTPSGSQTALQALDALEPLCTSAPQASALKTLRSSLTESDERPTTASRPFAGVKDKAAEYVRGGAKGEGHSR